MGKSNGKPAKSTLPLKINLQSGMSLDAAEAVAAVYRSDWGRIVSILIGLIGDFDLAEEAAQEAFAAAVDQWRVSGVPEFPRAWIIQTARHKAIDRIRRKARFEEKLESYATSGLVRTVEEPDYDTSRDSRRSPSPDLHLLPPGAGPGGAGSADSAHPGRPGDGRDCAGISRA